MRNLFLATAAATSLLGASIAAGGAQAAPPSQPAPQLIFGVDRAGDMPTLDKVQFLFGGRNFCWYDNGWQGPGFYWCGYAERRGLGWGGGAGWNGWQRGGGGGGHANVGARNAGSFGRTAGGGARVTAARGTSARTTGAGVAVTQRGGGHAATHGAAGHTASHAAGGDHKPG
jgi:hypothetical protein